MNTWIQSVCTLTRILSTEQNENTHKHLCFFLLFLRIYAIFIFIFCEFAQKQMKIDLFVCVCVCESHVNTVSKITMFCPFVCLFPFDFGLVCVTV